MASDDRNRAALFKNEKMSMQFEPESTGSKKVNRQKLTQFKPGQIANPNGRPKGSRNKLAEDFVADLQTVWAEVGIECLRRLGEKQPAKLAQLVAYTMPKEFVVRDASIKELSDEQVSEMLTALQDSMGSNAKVINNEADVLADVAEYPPKKTLSD